MKKILSLFVILLMAVGYADAQEAMIQFSKTIHDFGDFSEDSPVVTHAFEFKNTGDAPLVIHQAVASCGCTVPTYTREPILPGQSGTITVTYNGTGRYVGRFKKSITVKSNSKNPMTRLYIQGNMTPSEKDKKN